MLLTFNFCLLKLKSLEVTTVENSHMHTSDVIKTEDIYIKIRVKLTCLIQKISIPVRHSSPVTNDMILIRTNTLQHFGFP